MPETTLGIALGSLSAVVLGVGDFLARGVTHAIGWKRTLLWLQVASVVPLLGVAWLLGDRLVPSGAAWAGVLAVGVLNFVGAGGLFRAFLGGALSLVSPIASTFAVVTVALSAVFGQMPGPPVLLGLAVTMLGLGVATVSPGGGFTTPRMASGVGWALLSSLGFGSAFFLLDRVASELGAAWPVVGMRVVAGVLMWMVIVRWPERVSARAPKGRILTVALLDSTGVVAYAAGTLHGHVAVVAVLSSCFAIVTLLLAQLRLGERLAASQWAGILVVLAGVVWTTYHARAA